MSKTKPSSHVEFAEANSQTIPKGSSITLKSNLLPHRLHSVGPHREYKARLVASGRIRASGNRESKIILDPEALQKAAFDGLFNAKAVFADHAGWFDYPSIDNLAGVTLDTLYNEQAKAVEGTIRLYDTPTGQVVASLLDNLLEEPENAPDIGLSMVFYPIWQVDPNDDDRHITGISHIESVDLVFEPAADGRILAALSSIYAQRMENGVAVLPRDSEGVSAQGLETALNSPQSLPSINAALMENNVENSTAILSNNRETVVTEGVNEMPPNRTAAPEEEATPIEVSDETSQETTPVVSGQVSIPAAQEQVPQPAENPPQDSEWLNAAREAATNAALVSSGLPQHSQDRLSSLPFETPQDLQDAIEAERAYLAQLEENSVINVGGQAPRSGNVSGMLNSLDRIEIAAEALLSGIRPDGIAPLSGIRELYTLLSGDYELTGMFQQDRMMLANVTSSTMANLVANVLNKRVVNEFQQYPLWWDPITIAMDFPSLQQVKWITLGGVGELPTVAEGAAYTELTWDDAAETADFVKKGGYLGITLETIDKDDTGRVRAAPRALAQAAWLTLSKSISAIFTSNSGVGPTTADSVALFDAGGHGNLLTTALSVTAYTAVRTAMRKQTELNSAERLGALTAPKFLLVPPDLEITALQVLASEFDYTYALSNGTAAPSNAHAMGDGWNARMEAARSRVIVVDLWTDTNNWAAVADPRMYPGIGLAFRYGRTPEVFSVASPTAGLMFSNDTMPVKVRYFYATGPMDYRGLHKSNVA